MIALIFPLFVGSCLGQAVDVGQFNASAWHLFHGADGNADGHLTKLELEQAFRDGDANGNGKETRHEWTEYICSIAPELYNMGHYLYDEFDQNGDHTMQQSDYDILFLRLDANRDGIVSEAEYDSFAMTMFLSYGGDVGPHAQTHGHGNSACH